MNAPAYRSNLNPVFRSKFSEDIFNLKYRHAEAETWDELSKTVAIDVAGQYLHKDELASLIEMIRNQEFIPGGRYLYYAGREVKFFNNCFLLCAETDTREDWANLAWKAKCPAVVLVWTIRCTVPVARRLDVLGVLRLGLSPA